MALKDTLTNETLSLKYGNASFDLVTYAISLAKIKVERGEGLDSNPANDVLEMIAKGTETQLAPQFDNDDEEELTLVESEEGSNEEKK